MLKMYVARHGQDEDSRDGVLNGRRDTSLTKIGVKQASRSAERVRDAGLTFDAIYTSPLKRAYGTADIFAAVTGSPEPVRWPALIERDFGVMTGKSPDTIKQLFADIIETDTITYFLEAEGAETFPRVLQRAQHVLLHLPKMHEEGDVLLVAHGDIGKMLYAAYYDRDWLDVLTQFHFGNAEMIELSAGADQDDPFVIRVEQHNL